MSDNFSDPGQGHGKINIAFGAIIALVAATAYSFYQVSQLRTELGETREMLAAEISKVSETTNVSTKTGRASVDSLKADVDAARKLASQLAGQARIDASKHADDLASELQRAQQVQAQETAKVAQSVTAVSGEVSQVRNDTNVNGTRVTEVSTNLDKVKTQADATKSELEKTIAELTSTRGDLGVQSGLIATNGKQLQALKALGERNYTEFSLKKAKDTQRIGDLQVRLTNADVKRNRYTIEVIVDDKKVERKDRAVNEPVQFILSRSVIPYEFVVNEVKKDVIAGYLAAPKVQQSRTASNN